MTVVETDQEAFVLKVSCQAGMGIVAKVSNFLSDNGCYIDELAQFDNRDSQKLFMRIQFRVVEGDANRETLDAGFVTIAEQYKMDWQFFTHKKPVKTLIMVSKFDHCLDDLLYRLRKGDLNIEVTAVVSNHLDARPMVEREGIRFVYLPVNKDTKPEQEKALLDIIDETGTELVILARYMQVLSDDLCQKLEGRVINIHHSFLPGFKGAKPYHQAFERGVKLIGATAHYVNKDLDEGPIIEQAVQHIDHNYSANRLVAVGRDTETIALARAVKLHSEHRVFLDENKTVIFK